MEHQLTFADIEFFGKRHQTRKEIFLFRMEAILPWAKLLAVFEPAFTLKWTMAAALIFYPVAYALPAALVQSK